MPDRWELGPKGQRLIEEDGAIVIKLSDEQVKMLVDAMDRLSIITAAAAATKGFAEYSLADGIRMFNDIKTRQKGIR